MKSIKKLLATATLIGIIIIGATTTKAGIIVSYNETNKPCTQTTDTKVNNGIIVSLTGIIVSLTGIIVSFSDDSKAPTECGIIVS